MHNNIEKSKCNPKAIRIRYFVKNIDAKIENDLFLTSILKLYKAIPK